MASVPRPADAADRIGDLLLRGALGLLAAAVVGNAGEVVARTHAGVPVTEALAAAVAVQVAARQLRRWRDGVATLAHLRTAAVVLAAQAVVALASTLWAADATAAVSDATALATDIAIAGVILLAVRDDDDLRWVIGGLLAGSGTVALLASVQTLTGSFDQTFGGFAQVSLAHVAGETDDVRVTGPFEDPNFFAQAMVATLPLALAVPHAWRGRAVRAAAAAAALALTVATVATLSRGALLALAAIVVVTVRRLRVRRTALVGAVAVLLAAILVLPAGYLARLTAVGGVASAGAAGTDDPSLQGRTSEMTAAALMFVDHPVGGVGYGNYAGWYLRYSPWIGLDPRREMREAHSLFLEVAAETGILGVAALGIGLALARARVAHARRVLQALGATDGVALVEAVGLALVAFLITSVFLRLDLALAMPIVVGIWFAAPHGVTVVAVVHLLAVLIYAPVRLTIANRVVGASLRGSLTAMWPGICLSIGVAAVALPLGQVDAAAPVRLALTVGGGVLGAVVALVTGAPGAIADLRALWRALRDR